MINELWERSNLRDRHATLEDLYLLPRHSAGQEQEPNNEENSRVELGPLAVMSLAQGFQNGQCFIYVRCCPCLGREDVSHDPIFVNDEAYTASEQSKGLLHTVGSSN